jgi:hypothetical protein
MKSVLSRPRQAAPAAVPCGTPFKIKRTLIATLTTGTEDRKQRRKL